MPVLETYAIIHTVLSTIQSVTTWIQQVRTKQEKVRHLERTMESLLMVLEPLRASPGPSSQPTAPILNRNILAQLYDLAEILNGVKEHIQLWGSNTKSSKFVNILGLLNPSIALGMLGDDESRITQWINLFTLSLQIVSLKKQMNVEVTLNMTWMSNNGDVSQFWEKSFGDEKVFVVSVKFISALQRWVKENLDETMRSALLLVVDRYDIGGVTRTSLDGFSGGRTLKQCIADLRAQSAHSPQSNGRASRPPMATTLQPTLVWVDDRMENNLVEIDYAESLGIRVIELPSTATAKLWVEKNEDELRLLESNGLLQFITDNARWESTGVDSTGVGYGALSLDMAAGEATLRFLRGCRFMAPVLVYCGRNVVMTEYVKEYSHAGSTLDRSVCNAFIYQLAPSRNGTKGREEFWKVFEVRQGFNLLPAA
ncbi:hypothetical protein AX17_003781 [Amanita inopinata Kibby_2008]|nr:hypothetical protein AX17_003781 [Amanita inopinata Kibby_2008]